MVTGSPADVASVVVAAAQAHGPTLGDGRLVCIDGPAGSGKSTLAAAVVARTDARLVHVDDLMHGWAHAMDTAGALRGLVEPLAAGRPGRYEHWDWAADRVGRVVEVAPSPWLVIEGVGCGRVALAALITTLVWVEVDDDLRLTRGLDRDGAEMESQWRRFMADETTLFARERTRDRADVLVDGTGSRPPVVR